ncbi:DUF1566 domain-containing protein [Thiothrix subterranea]|uniref:Lcl domain-containing protein n=1 Tax=Thiothrix subterranea TaxID=2735563 RepID=UPI00192B11AB|nr:DUF1566 domain-containing protein [Thiothrix subterranea]QQZ30537.1 DUF1566 domain-containing protein [Thiothrix subterranea]
MPIISIYSQLNNDGLTVKKISIAVSSVLLSTILGACSSNNNGASETGDSNGAGTVVATASADPSTSNTTGTGSTGTTDNGTGGTIAGGSSGTGTGGTTGGDGTDTGGTTGGDGTGTGGTTGGDGTGTGGTTGSDGTGTGGTTGSDGIGTGSTGFPSLFVKLDVNGGELPADADTWSCILDTKTGLIWEVKTNDGGLRDKDWRYQYDGSSGLTPAGTEYPCTGVYACNPMSYIEALNTYGVCGKTDWHLPTDAQMSGVGEPQSEPPHINLAAFPNFNTDLPYCIAKSNPGHYQGIHFGMEIPEGADLLDALKVNMSDYDFQCRVLAVSY